MANNSDQDILLEEQVIRSADGSSPSKRRKKGGRSTGGGASAVWDHFLKVAKENKCKFFCCIYWVYFYRWICVCFRQILQLHNVGRVSRKFAGSSFASEETYANYLARSSAKTIPKLSSKSSTSKSLSSPNSTVSTASSTIRYYDEDSDHYKNSLNAVALLFASNCCLIY